MGRGPQGRGRNGRRHTGRMQIQVEVNQLSRSTAEGQARTHRVLVDRPLEKGGEDQGMMGGEYLLVALGGCFMSNLLAARKINLIVNDSAKERLAFTGYDVNFGARQVTVRPSRCIFALEKLLVDGRP